MHLHVSTKISWMLTLWWQPLIKETVIFTIKYKYKKNHNLCSYTLLSIVNIYFSITLRICVFYTKIWQMALWLCNTFSNVFDMILLMLFHFYSFNNVDTSFPNILLKCIQSILISCNLYIRWFMLFFSKMYFL